MGEEQEKDRAIEFYKEALNQVKASLSKIEEIQSSMIHRLNCVEFDLKTAKLFIRLGGYAVVFIFAIELLFGVWISSKTNEKQDTFMGEIRRELNLRSRPKP